MNLFVPAEAIGSNGFIRGYLPKYLMAKSYAKLDQSKSSAMNAYLRGIGVNIPVCEILKKAYFTLECEGNGDYGTLRISTAVKINDFTLSQLCRLIDNGNREIKGLGIVSHAFDCAQMNINALIEAYLMEI